MARIPAILLVCLGAASVSCARYTSAPLDPMAVASELETRRLDDPELLRYLAGQGARPPADGWSDGELVLAAYYFHPALETARARWRAAEAAVVTAGGRVRPGIEAEAGYGVTGSDVFESPWVAALAAVFTLELGGKRASRIAAARARAAAAALEVDGTAAALARSVRAATWEFAAAAARVEEARRVREASEAVAGAARARYARGESRSAEVGVAEADVLAAHARAAALASAVPLATAALAQAVGVPAAALDGLSVHRSAVPPCAPPTAVDSLTRSALRRRSEVGSTLAAYAVAETDLRVAVAGSYPDLALGPGFTWDQGVGRWSVLLGLPRLPLDGNRGAIAEAMARREVAAAAVAAVQLRVRGEVESAVGRCGAAAAEAAGADSLAAGAERRLDAARQAFTRGEAPAADTVAAFLVAAKGRAAAADAHRRQTEAALALEAAVGSWTAPGGADPRRRTTPGETS